MKVINHTTPLKIWIIWKIKKRPNLKSPQLFQPGFFLVSFRRKIVKPPPSSLRKILVKPPLLGILGTFVESERVFKFCVFKVRILDFAPSGYSYNIITFTNLFHSRQLLERKLSESIYILDSFVMTNFVKFIGNSWRVF